jgi:uncharacterized protein YndB with AHSA1/START domain
MTTASVTVEDVGPALRAIVKLPGCTAEQWLSAFTDPARVARWWDGELSTDLVVGGPYVVRFPARGQTLDGQVVGYEPTRLLEFTWSFDGTDGPRRTVVVRAAPSKLTITHGPHGDTETERAARAEHRAGWESALPRLVISLGAQGQR